MRISLRNSTAALLGVAALAGLGTIAGTAAASTQNTVAVQHLDVTASDSNLSDGGLTRLDPSMTRVTLHNSGTGEHALHLVRLHDGVTAAQFETTLRSADMPAINRLITWYGGVNSCSGRQVRSSLSNSKTVCPSSSWYPTTILESSCRRYGATAP